MIKPLVLITRLEEVFFDKVKTARSKLVQIGAMVEKNEHAYVQTKEQIYRRLEITSQNVFLIGIWMFKQ